MSKSIKLVTRVGDEEVVVGRCHPGQARILRKSGLAEWDNGRLILTTSQAGKPPLRPGFNADGTPYMDPSAKPLILEGEVQEHVLMALLDALPPGRGLKKTEGGLRVAGVEWKPGGVFEKVTPIKDDSWKVEAGQIDPEGELVASFSSNKEGWNSEVRRSPQEIVCDTLLEWGTEAKTRRDAGHTLYTANAAKRLMLGFVDDDDDKVFYVPIRKLHSAKNEDYEELGATRKALSTNEGREEFLGADTFFTGGGETPLINDGVPELSEIWLQEAEEEGAGIREIERNRLAEKWALAVREDPQKEVWTVDDVRELNHLKPREEFLELWRKRKEEAPDIYVEERGSGKTTELALQVATSALNGKRVQVRSGDYALTESLRRYVLMLVQNCDPRAEVNVRPSREESLEGYEIEVFEDHVIADWAQR